MLYWLKVVKSAVGKHETSGRDEATITRWLKITKMEDVQKLT